jgi:hypothetical protein
LDPFRSNTNKNNAKTLYLQVKQKEYHRVLKPEHFLANNVWIDVENILRRKLRFEFAFPHGFGAGKKCAPNQQLELKQFQSEL